MATGWRLNRVFTIQTSTRILFSVMAIFMPCLTGAAYSPEPIYTESEVYKNSREFVSHLLGDQPLTLADYHKYYSHHWEYESQEDRAYCNRKWGASLTCGENGKLTLEQNCKQFTRSKYMNKTSPSLFLTRLRDMLSKFGTGFSIDSVEPARVGDIWSSFKVYGKIGDKKIELFHARTDLALELGGLVNLARIDGKVLWDIVSVNYPETKRCN